VKLQVLQPDESKAGPVPDEAPAEAVPRLRVQSPFGDQAKVALFLVLINVDAEDGPVGVGWLEPRRALLHAPARPACALEHLVDERGHRIDVRGNVHGYYGRSLRFQFEAYCPNRER